MTKKGFVNHNNSVLKDVRSLTVEQLEQKYDIFIESDGSVDDSCYGYYNSLAEWAIAVAEDMDDSAYSRTTIKIRSSRDYYDE